MPSAKNCPPKYINTAPVEFSVESYVDEVRLGPRVYLTHPLLLFSELRGSYSVYAAANILYLSEEIFPESIARLEQHEFDALLDGRARPVARKLVIKHGKWGEQAYILATKFGKELIEQLDVVKTFPEADINDVMIEWEDQAWIKAATELYDHLPIDTRLKLGTFSERKRNQLMWDAYITAKNQTRYKPEVKWNGLNINIWAIKGPYIYNLCNSVASEVRANVQRLPRQDHPSSAAASEYPH